MNEEFREIEFRGTIAVPVHQIRTAICCILIEIEIFEMTYLTGNGGISYEGSKLSKNVLTVVVWYKTGYQVV